MDIARKRTRAIKEHIRKWVQCYVRAISISALELFRKWTNLIKVKRKTGDHFVAGTAAKKNEYFRKYTTMEKQKSWWVTVESDFKSCHDDHTINRYSATEPSRIKLFRIISSQRSLQSVQRVSVVIESARSPSLSALPRALFIRGPPSTARDSGIVSWRMSIAELIATLVLLAATADACLRVTPPNPGMPAVRELFFFCNIPPLAEFAPSLQLGLIV